MSIVVAAAPISLMAALGHLLPLLAIASSGAIIEGAVNAVAPNLLYNRDDSRIPELNSGVFHINEDLVGQIFDKEIKTNIMDKETLVKTLTEHGADIIDMEDNFISCAIEGISMDFSKNSESEPYTVYIQYRNEETLTTLVDELDEEYKANAQEVSYNKILKNLEEKNYSIEEEEIMDDNTIVLTVNLE